MARLLLSQDVHAPAGAVFDYFDQYENYEKFFHGFSQFTWTDRRHRTGTRLKMLAGGFSSLPTETVTTAVVPEREIAAIFVSGMRGLWDWLFQPLGDRTRVTVVVDYELPTSVLGQVADQASAEREFRLDLEKTLAALRKRVETLPSTAD